MYYCIRGNLWGISAFDQPVETVSKYTRNKSCFSVSSTVAGWVDTQVPKSKKAPRTVNNEHNLMCKVEHCQKEYNICYKSHLKQLITFFNKVNFKCCAL